MKQRSRGFCL